LTKSQLFPSALLSYSLSHLLCLREWSFFLFFPCLFLLWSSLSHLLLPVRFFFPLFFILSSFLSHLLCLCAFLMYLLLRPFPSYIFSPQI
jgi:hypothetical protein